MTHLLRAGRPGGKAVRRLFLAAVLFFSGLSVHGQTAGVPLSLTPDTAVQMAVQSNLSLETARIALDIRQRKSDYVWNQFIPSVSVTGNLSRDNWANTSTGIDFSALPNLVPYTITLPQWHVNGTFSTSLDFSFALIEGMKSTRLDYGAGVISLDKAKLQIE